MTDILNRKADLITHHIEGLPKIEGEAHMGGGYFNIPLISHVKGNLWQGGCLDGASLGGMFKHIISLYPWERYNPGGDLDSFTEVRLFDSHGLPDADQLYSLARWINICKATGTTLVHCQAGLNRSGLLAGLSLVLDGMTPKAAIKLLRTGRCAQVLVNPTFEAWLLKQKRPRKTRKKLTVD
jgi:hypothetical protein